MKRSEIVEKIRELQEKLSLMDSFGPDNHPVGTILAGTILDAPKGEVYHFAYLKITDTQWASTAHAYYADYDSVISEIDITLRKHPESTIRNIRIIGPNIGKVIG